MLKKFSKKCFFSIATLMCGLSSESFAQSTFVSIPDALQGFYTLEMVNATPLSPIQNTILTNSADDVLLYVTGYGELCSKNKTSGAVDLIASAPSLR